MASDDVKKSSKSKDKSEKKDKKRSEEGGIKKEKKDKKSEKKKADKLASALERHLNDSPADVDAPGAEGTPKKSGKVDPEDLIKPAEELVPFALPLADEKAHKKIYKLIKKGAKLKAIHRGVKECEKAIKKTPLKKTGIPSGTPPPGLVVIAADISPMDVIMHFPILCEEHGVPYIYIRSRADLGVAACTKRATSVVMLRMEGKPAKGEDKEMKEGDEEGEKKVSAEEYAESWKELVKLAEKQWTVQVEPWVKGTHPLQLAAGALA
ncbi:snoRNA-binding protein [Coniochaeta pulveracea]|uniref:SnoRNA-binding protein n=1 Tax=Coniochaeta pulveracea TaxID=177199 RepID=A0A420YNY6_9PEZI|nr:snoRNA-binding protein [Coniochaeta pulveracea]